MFNDAHTCPRNRFEILTICGATALSLALSGVILSGCERSRRAQQEEHLGELPPKGRMSDVGIHADPTSHSIGQPLDHLGNIVKDSFGSNGRDWMVGRLEFRDGLVAVASREGVTPMAVAARLIASARSEDERDNIIVAVRDCFRGLEWDIALAKELPAGRQRSRIVNGRAIGLAQQDRDLVGLKTLYDSIPVGADRANVAGLGANLTVSLNGLPAALDYIAALEMPEERFAAFRVINTKANFAGYATDKEVQEKCDAIVESFPPQQRETYRYLRGKQR